LPAGENLSPQAGRTRADLQMGQVVVMPQEPERILPKWKMAWSNAAFSQKVRVMSGSLLVERSDARGLSA